MSKNKKFGNLRKSYEDIIFVSKLTKTNKKKLTIFTAVVTANLIALMDILLIVSFTAIITNETRFGNFQLLYVEFLLENLWVLPLIVVIRYFCIYFQALIEKIMVLNIQKNLKLHILEEIFEKRNYSTADAYFYIDNVTGHIAFFYTALITFANSIIQSFGFVAYLYFPAIVSSSDGAKNYAQNFLFFVLFFPLIKTGLRTREGAREREKVSCVNCFITKTEFLNFS